VSDSYVGDLLDAGVELYRYDNGFLHAKLVIVDDTLASVGTANMDYRSLTDNLEVTAFIRDRETVRQLAATFDDDLASCRRITRAEWRPPLWRRTLGDVLRLVSPLM
jgi:cardiolipin synthase